MKIAKSEQNKIKRYIRLDQLLRDADGFTLNEILADSQMDNIGKRSLHDNLKEFEDVFGAEFDLCAYRGRERLWKYKDNTFTIFKQVNLDVEMIREAIEKLKSFQGDPRYDWLRFYLSSLEGGVENSINVMSFDTNMDYTGLNFMESLAQAIIHKYPVKLTYKPFGSEAFVTNMHPYHLRQYNCRWFVFGYSEENKEIRNYPLDRIDSVEHLSKPYIETDIDFDEFFDEIIGVSNYRESSVEKIILKVAKKSINYIRTKPLHWTQIELKDKETENHCYLQLKVKINTELKMLLFSYSDAIEVIEPLYLRDFFRKRIDSMRTMYEV